jgi:hypothetical protein
VKEDSIMFSNGLGSDWVGPSQDLSGSLSVTAVGSSGEEEVGVLDTSERSKKGKAQKKKRKSHHYGHKFLILQEYLQKKGGANSKRKMKKRGSKKQDAMCSLESDPITCSGGLEAAGDRICDHEGIRLEVVLPSGGGSEVLGRMGSGAEMVGAGVVGHEVVGVRSDVVSVHQGGGGVNLDCHQAHHVIDILEEVGMNFNGSREENVRRMVEAEERDRAKLLEWEQNIGHQ